ncbi:MAG: CcdB family protein [Pseudomonadota bacterium]
MQAVLVAKYDVYPSPAGAGYVLDVQTDLLSDLNTRVVVPLLPLSEAPKAADRLNPVFEIGGEPHVMVTQFLSAIPQSALNQPISNVSARFDDITAALDMVFQGF